MSTAEQVGARWAPLEGAHYLHAQKSSRVPRRFVFMDTEAHREQTKTEETQTWRCGVTAVVKWRPDSGTWSPVVPTRHETAEALWEAVDAFARKDARTVVVAHKAAYDLRISRAFEVLPALGWAVGKLTLSGDHVSLDLHKDGRALCLVDSATVLPTTIATLADWRGEAKPPLPAEDDSAEAWWERCEADVKTLAWAYLEVVDWLRRDDLGCWARTGSGLGWHTLLRRHLEERVLVHAQKPLLDLEGQACYAGRAEAWRPGDWRGTKLTEWDYELAYCSVMEDEALPARYLDEVRQVSLERMVSRSAELAYLVEADVTTEVPMLPWRDRHGVCWPVGRFSGWWWHWELAEAVAAGAKVKLGRAHRYAASPWLAGWAYWAREQVNDRTTPEAKVRSLVAKHWTRAVVGRSGMKFRSWEEQGPAYVPGVLYQRAVNYDTGKLGAILELGQQRFEAWDERWWDSALPQVLSAVMAHLRVRLWRAMTAVGLEHVVYVDTDCLLTTSVGSAVLAKVVGRGELPGLRVKSTHDDLEIMAPQLVEGSSYRRLSGVPRRARRVGERTYESERWEGLTGSLAGGTPGAVHISPLRQDLDLVDWRRRHTGEKASEAYGVDGDQRELPTGPMRSGTGPKRTRALRPYQS